MTRTRSHRELWKLWLAGISVMLASGCASAVPAASPSTTTSQAAASSTAAGSVIINGTYRFTLTQEDAEKAGDAEAKLEGAYPQTQTVVLKDGELEGGCFGREGGTYEIDGDRIVFQSIEYDASSTVTFTVDDQGTLHLTPVPPMDPGDAFQCFSKPWTKIE